MTSAVSICYTRSIPLNNIRFGKIIESLIMNICPTLITSYTRLNILFLSYNSILYKGCGKCEIIFYFFSHYGINRIKVDSF